VVPAPTRTVAIVAFERLQLLDLAGPLEVFDAASRLADPHGEDHGDDQADRGPHPAYRVVVATPEGRTVRTSSGLPVAGDHDLHHLVAGREPIDTLVVVGGRGTRAVVDDQPFLADVRALSARARRTTSVCTGALVLAAAGLLDGYRATTHWDSCGLLAELAPEVTVEPDRIYVHDRDRWTSAGVTAGIDLALALVEDDLGPEVAHEVAAWLVVFARRPGGQAQFSAQLRAQAARTPAIVGLQRWLPDHLAEDLSVARLAERAAMSPRTFARAFRAETGTTPAAHVEELRVEAARRLLETTDLTVAAIARRVGMRHAETLHRSFARRVGTTPDRYRQHFARRSA
jgi:transcriptional regulator GlxA family with amidase domain